MKGMLFRGKELTYGFVTPVLFPNGGGKGRASLVEGEGMEGVLNAVAEAGVVEGVFFHAFGLNP